MKRSDFLKTGGAFVICACGSSLLHGCKAITGNSGTPSIPENSFVLREGWLYLDLHKIPELAERGGSVKLELTDPNLKIIIAKTGEQTFIALRDQCSHGGRELEYHHDQGMFRCVSFGHSKFDTTGKVIKGPAKGNIEEFDTTLLADEIRIDIS